MNDLTARMRATWQRIEPGTDDVAVMTQASALLAEAAHEIETLRSFARHKHPCLLDKSHPTDYQCVCGLDRLLEFPDSWPAEPPKKSRMCPECGACGGADGVTNCATCRGGFWEHSAVNGGSAT